MEKRPLFTLLGLLAAAGAFADAYTWTDDNGIVHYSDRPNPGAKKIVLWESTAPRPRPSSRSTTAQSVEPAAKQAFTYSTIAVASPAPEETLWNIGGNLRVSILLTPELRPGHQVRLYYDGSPRTYPSLSFQMQEVYRGAHNLQVEILDEAGTLMIRSQPSRFYVHQNTVSAP